MAKKKRKIEDISEEEKLDLEMTTRVNPKTGRVKRGASKKFIKKALRKEARVGELDTTPESATTPPKPSVSRESALVKNLGDIGKAVKQTGGKGLVVDPNSLDMSGLGKSPTNQIADALMRKNMFSPSASDEERNNFEWETEAAHMANDAVAQEEAQIKSGTKAIERAINTLENPEIDGATLTTGEPVDSVITKNDIIDETYNLSNSAAADDPEFLRKAKEHMDFLKKSRVQGGSPAIEKMGLQQYYPDINQSNAVGSYSRSMLGSGNIYVAGGGFIPVGIIDARKRALENAAKTKAKNDHDMLAAIMKADGAIQYNDQILNMQMNILEKYGGATGGESGKWDISALHSGDTALSREFLKEMQEMRVFAAQTKDMNVRSKNILEASLSEKKYVSSEARIAAQEYLGGSANMEQMSNDRGKLRDQMNLLRSWDDIQYNATQIAEKLKADELPISMKGGFDFNDPKIASNMNEALFKIRHGQYDEGYRMLVKYVDTSRIDALVDGAISGGHFYSSATFDPRAEMIKSVMAQEEVITKIETTQAMHRNASHARLVRLDALKEKEGKYWTNIHSAAGNANTLSFNSQAAGVENANAKEDAFQHRIQGDTGAPPIVDKDGNYVKGRIEHNITVAPNTKSGAMSLGNMQFDLGWKSGHTTDLKGLKEYTRHIQALEKNDPNRVSFDAKYGDDYQKFILDVDPNYLIKDVAVTKSTIGYGRMTNGKLTPMRTGHTPEDWNGAESMGTVYYQGHEVETEVQEETPEGKPLFQWIVVDTEGVEKPVGLPNDDKGVANAFVAANEGWEIVAERPVMKKQKFTLPPMEERVMSTDANNTAAMNSAWEYSNKGMSSTGNSGSTEVSGEAASTDLDRD